jgi:hypothetical protein
MIKTAVCRSSLAGYRATGHFILTVYYQRYFRVNVVADKIQFNCQLEGDRTLCLWRGSLLPLDREAVPQQAPRSVRQNPPAGFAAASQPSGSKLPRHKSYLHRTIESEPKETV